jgi:uncharacterized protein (DUF2236 family)
MTHTDFFPPDSVIRRVNAEPAILLGAGRALMLQLAHPNVAQGVDDHSDFQRNPFKRLQGTLEATYAVVFGSRELAEGVGRRIRWIHDYVTGPSYAANDPENLMWVHATLLDTALTCYERVVGPLDAGDRETYYQQMTRVAEVFGCPRDAQPANFNDFDAYFSKQAASLVVTDVARRLAGDIVRPTLPLKLHAPLAPVLTLHRRAAIGLTPPALREQFGLNWTDDDQRKLDLLFRTAAKVSRATPRQVRTFPGWLNGRYLLWLAGRHVASFENRENRKEFVV